MTKEELQQEFKRLDQCELIGFVLRLQERIQDLEKEIERLKQIGIYQ